MQLTDVVIVAVVGAASSVGGIVIKSWYDKRTADDLRVNDRVRMLLDSYEERIAQMETQMGSMRDELLEVTTRLNLAQEERRMADLTIETAHMRVEDLETELTAARENLKTQRDLLGQAAAREAGLTTQNETLRKRIVALEARVAELEGMLETYRSIALPERIVTS
jgi:chromosome segregation ATPase